MDTKHPKKTLSRLRTGLLERNFALGKLSVGVSVSAGLLKLKSLLADESGHADRVREFFRQSAGKLAEELGGLKGSLMKAGQVLSVYGEQFLPNEVTEALRSLHNESTPVEWPVIERLLREELGDRFDRLDIDREPLGAASLGQVHRAVDRRSGSVLALKVRYPGVDKAIEADLWVLRRMLSVAGLLPKIENLDHVFEEARRMLRQEVDYLFEATATERYRQRLVGEPAYVVPAVIGEFSTAGVLCTAHEPSVSVRSPEVRALPQERRDALARSFFDLYLREIFEFRSVQSDAHFGNFGVRLGSEGAPDRWVLYDFGAVRDLPEDFVRSYGALIRSSLAGDTATIVRCLEELRLTGPDDDPVQVQGLVELCELGLEGIRGPGIYRWGESTLPQRVAEKARALLLRGRVRAPRPELLSVDRKTSGVFVTLATLRAELELRPLVECRVAPR